MNLFLSHLIAHRARIVVETGTLRNPDEGQSTRIFATFVHPTRATFYSVDIDPKAADRARADLHPWMMERTKLITDDSVTWLEERAPHGIDGLYLDSMDVIPGSTAHQTHQLAEVWAALPKLSAHAAILLDDDADEFSKGALARPLLIANGWKLVKREYQSLLVRA